MSEHVTEKPKSPYDDVARKVYVSSDMLRHKESSDSGNGKITKEMLNDMLDFSSSFNGGVVNLSNVVEFSMKYTENKHPMKTGTEPYKVSEIKELAMRAFFITPEAI